MTFTRWQLRSYGCFAQNLMMTNPKMIEGTAKAMLNHSTASGLNQMSNIPGIGPVKIVWRGVRWWCWWGVGWNGSMMAQDPEMVSEAGGGVILVEICLRMEIKGAKRRRRRVCLTKHPPRCIL